MLNMTSGETDPTAHRAIGVDVGGTGIKAAVVDLSTGEVISERLRVDTPHPATPEAVRDGIVTVIDGLRVEAPIGVALPAVVQRGVTRTAANLDKTWLGASVEDVLGSALPGNPVYLNDADAAGLAEARFGAGRGERGLVIMVTLGTGIGTALIHDGRLIPNAELGHLELDGIPDAEVRTSARAREIEGLGWDEWAARVSRYLGALENLLWPDLFVIGGGVSRHPDPWFPQLKARTPIRLAQLSSNAGIVGAAIRTELA